MLGAISAGQSAWRANIGSSPMPTTPSISFVQDGAGRIAARSLDLGSGPEITRYAYDSAGRLARVTDGGGALRESYQYDREARRLADINPLRFRGERRYTYSLGDRLLQAGDAQYAHDPAGFRSLKVAAGRQTQYHYEPSGLLLAVELPDGRRVEYGYDADGLRREKRIDGQPAEAFRWLDPLRLLEFYDGERWWRLAYTQGRTPVGVTDGSNAFLFLSDQIGTPLALATPDGNVVQTMRYDSFGNPLRGLQGPVRLPLGFAGGLFDADTGLTRFVWRDYDADTGRFTALDPLGEKGGDNDWYGYCLDDPINRADVWGLEDSWWDGPGGRIIRSGLKGMGTGAISGAGAGFAAGGIGTVPGAVVGASIGLPIGLLKGVGTEVYRQYLGDFVQDKAKELSESLSEQSKALRKQF
jgi:RHS repeat-associated protein